MTGIVNLYFCQIEPEIRAFHFSEFVFEEVQYSSSIYPTLLILLTTKHFAKAAKNWVSLALTDNFYGLAAVYHQYAFKYEKI